MSRLFRIACYALFGIIALHAILAEFLHFKYSFNNVWVSKILLLTWLVLTFYLIFNNWNKIIAKVAFVVILLIPFTSLFASEEELNDAFLSSINKDLEKRVDFDSYSAYAKRTNILGYHVFLYKKNSFLKEYISSKSENEDAFKVKDAEYAEVLYESKEKITVKFFNKLQHKIIEFERSFKH